MVKCGQELTRIILLLFNNPRYGGPVDVNVEDRKEDTDLRPAGKFIRRRRFDFDSPPVRRGKKQSFLLGDLAGRVPEKKNYKSP